jgi:hypothetical protein
MSRPNCEWCQKPLSKYKYADEEWAKNNLTGDGNTPTFGKNGCNVFCSQTCGFNWAVRELRKASHA